MGSEERIEVEGYSGYKANERPLRFYIKDRRMEVSEILDRWYGPDHDYFKVRAGGRAYLLKRHRSDDAWWLIGGGEDEVGPG